MPSRTHSSNVPARVTPFAAVGLDPHLQPAVRRNAGTAVSKGVVCRFVAHCFAQRRRPRSSAQRTSPIVAVCSVPRSPTSSRILLIACPLLLRLHDPGVSEARGGHGDDRALRPLAWRPSDLDPRHATHAATRSFDAQDCAGGPLEVRRRGMRRSLVRGTHAGANEDDGERPRHQARQRSAFPLSSRGITSSPSPLTRNVSWPLLRPLRQSKPPWPRYS